MYCRRSLGTGAVSRALFLEARRDILRYTDIGRRRTRYRRMDQASLPQPIDGCWGVAGVLLPPCHRTAVVLAYQSAPYYSNRI